MPTFPLHIQTLHTHANGLLETVRAQEATHGQALPSDSQAAAALSLARRTVELGLSAADDFHFDRPSAAFVDVRALFETMLLTRWCLQDRNQAQRWWDGAEHAAWKLHRATRRLRGQPPSPELSPSAGAIPSWQRMAGAVGMAEHYQLWYGLLSELAHANRASIHAVYRPKDDNDGPGPMIELGAIWFVVDVRRTYTHWLEHGIVPEPRPAVLAPPA